MRGNFRSKTTKRAVRISPGLLTLCAALAIMLVASFACGSSEGDTTPAVEWDVQNSAERADLSNLDTVEETEVEIIRLLGEGYVMYVRLEAFNEGGVYNLLSCRGSLSSKPQVVCENYPERIVRELWEATNLSGITQVAYGRESNLDGTLLATASGGEWTDVASGETWIGSPMVDRDLFAIVEDLSIRIDRVYERNLSVIDGEILGRPSVVVPDGVFEYQLANPFILRTTRWQERDDGTRYMLGEIKVVDFALLPPGSFPDFATTSGK